MLRERPRRQHKRNPSQVHSAKVTLHKEKPKNKKPASFNGRNSQPNRCRGDSDSELFQKLVANSLKKIPRKQLIIQDIEPDTSVQGSEEEFFRFGKRTTKPYDSNILNMEEIVQVPDTGSYSQRQTEQCPDNKQNLRHHSNRAREAQTHQLRIPIEKIDAAKQKEDHSYRCLNHSSKRSKSSRSNNCSFSTIELRGQNRKKGKKKGNAAEKGKIVGIEKQIKLIWDCIGEIWMHNKIAEQSSRDNAQKIQNLIRKGQVYERDLLELKMTFSERGKTTDAMRK